MPDYASAAKDYAYPINVKAGYTDFFNQGLCYKNLHQYEAAIPDFIKAISLRSDDPDTYFQCAECELNIGKTDSAITDYTNAIQLRPNYPGAYFGRASSYQRRGKCASALPDFDRAIALRPNYTRTIEEKENCRLQAHADTASMDTKTIITEHQASDPLAYFKRGQLYESKQNDGTALWDYAMALQLKPDFTEVLQKRGLLYPHRKEYQPAIADFNRLITLHSKDPMDYYHRAQGLDAIGDYDSAIADYTAVIEMPGNYTDVYYRRGIPFYKENKLKEAISDLTVVISRMNERDGIAYYRRGLAYYDQGDYAHAISDFNQAAKIKSTEQIILLQKNAYIATNKFQESAAISQPDANSGTFFNDKFYSFLSKYIDVCDIYLTTGDYQNGLLLLQKLLQNYRLSDFRGDHPGNVTATTRHIAIQYAHVLAKTGWVYKKLALNGKATEFYQKALVIDTNVQDIRKRLLQLSGPPSSDHTPPAIKLILPENGEAYVSKENTIYVRGTVTDPSGIEYIKVNGRAAVFAPDGFFQTVIDADAEDIHIDASDQKGNIAVQSYHIDKKLHTTNAATDTIPIEPEPERIHAILIACSNYSGGLWPQLPSTVQESEALRKMLIRKYNFAPGDIDTLYNKNRIEILSELSNRLQGLGEHDNLIIYFSGHGYFLPNQNTAYWVPLNAAAPYDYISNDDIDKLISGLAARHILIMADACFSGALRSGINTPNKYEYKFSSRQLLTSGGTEAVPGHSIYLRMILTALENNQAPYLSARTLYGLIYQGIYNQTKNEPTLRDLQVSGSKGGQFYFKMRKIKSDE